VRACAFCVLFMTLWCRGGQTQTWSVDKIVGLNYPKQALAAGVSGKVELRCHIGNDGKVMRVDRLSGDTELAAAAIENAAHWRFRRVNSGEGSYVLIYEFRIEAVRSLKDSPKFRFVMPGQILVIAEQVLRDVRDVSSQGTKDRP